MPEVLPAIAEEDGHAEASCRLQNDVDEFGHPGLPCGKAIGCCLQHMVDEHWWFIRPEVEGGTTIRDDPAPGHFGIDS